MSNYVSYTGDGVVTNFPITFEYARPTDLRVYVGGVSVSFTIEGSDAVVTPAPSGTVLIQRVTDIINPVVEFTNSSSLYAENVNDALDQCRFAIEDLGVIVGSGGVTGGGGGTSNVPNPTAATQFIASDPSGGGFIWAVKTKAQMQTLLEINPAGTTDTRLPNPSGANSFLLVNGAGNAYALTTVAAVKALLEIPTVNLPAIAGRASHVLMTDGSGSTYVLNDPTSVRSALGLGSAAQSNIGTAVGNVVQLVSSGSGPALPAISGINLTGIAKEPVTAIFQRTTAFTTSVGSFGGYAIMSQGLSAVGTPPSWASVASTGITLQPGTYQVRADYVSGGGQGTDAKTARVTTAGGTVTGNNTLAGPLDVDPVGTRDSVESFFTVTVATELRLEMGGGTAGPHTMNWQRLRITKIV